MGFSVQNTIFTCGPAVLMDAMGVADPVYVPSRLEEMLIWRTANLGFMGDGQAGCGVFGLGLAALTRGFQAIIYGQRTDGLFADWTNNEKEREIQILLDERDRSDFLYQGGQYKEIADNTKLDVLTDQLLPKGGLIALITTDDGMGHWVLVRGIHKNGIAVFDPWPGDGEKILPLSAFTYGSRKSMALLSVSKR